MDISIIVISYNTRGYLRKCLESIYGCEHACQFEVLVVDNASVDGSPEMVKSDFPQVTLIENRENVGFARANNQAIVRSCGRHIMLLNSDTEILPGALDRVVAFLDEHPEAGAVGIRTWTDREKMFQLCAAYTFTPALAVWQFTVLGGIFPNNTTFRRRWRSDWRTFLSEEFCEVESLVGHCLSVRRDTIDHIGLLDERFFLYFEDTDWSLRMRRAGWRLYFLASAEVVHHALKSAPDRAEASRLLLRSMRYYLRKHFGVLRSGALRTIFRLNGVLIRTGQIFGRSPRRRPKVSDERTIEIVDGRIEGDPVIVWPEMEGVEDYLIEISDSPHFMIKGLTRTDRTYLRLPDFFLCGWPDDTYYWRVVPLDREGCTGDLLVGAIKKRTVSGRPPQSRGQGDG